MRYMTGNRVFPENCMLRETANGEASMGDVRVELQVENFGDRYLVYQGLLSPDRVRAVRVKALVDSGAGTLVLPEEVVELLGLVETRRVTVTYADERTELRPMAGVATVRVGSRDANIDVLVGVRGSEPLLGQIPLEAMDLVIDCRNQRLVPNPASPDIPSMKIKVAA